MNFTLTRNKVIISLIIAIFFAFLNYKFLIIDCFVCSAEVIRRWKIEGSIGVFIISLLITYFIYSLIQKNK